MATFHRSSSNKEEFDERLYQMQKEVLNDNRQFLCKTISPARHFPYLRQENVLNIDGQELIQSEVTRSGKVLKLLEELESNGGPKAYLKFMESLRNDGTQAHVLSKLNKALEEKMYKPSVHDATNDPSPVLRRQPTQEDDSVESINTDLPEYSPDPLRPKPGDNMSLPSFDMLKSLSSQGGPFQSYSKAEENPENGPYGLLAHGVEPAVNQ